MIRAEHERIASFVFTSWRQAAPSTEHERMASVQLRTLIENVISDTSRDTKERCGPWLPVPWKLGISDTSRDMKEQADAVDAALQTRVVEVENAKSALEDNLRKVRVSVAYSSSISLPVDFCRHVVGNIIREMLLSVISLSTFCW